MYYVLLYNFEKVTCFTLLYFTLLYFTIIFTLHFIFLVAILQNSKQVIVVVH